MVGRKVHDQRWREESWKKNRKGGKRKWEEKKKKEKEKEKNISGLVRVLHVIRFFALLIFFSKYDLFIKKNSSYFRDLTNTMYKETYEENKN